jgi:hypothetical protein
MMRYKYDLDKEYRNRQEAKAEHQRLVQLVSESQSKKNHMAFIGNIINRVADALQRLEPEPTPKHREFKQRRASSTA